MAFLTTPGSEFLLKRFNTFLSLQMGFEFKNNKWDQFEKGIEAASREFGFTSPVKCMKWLMSGNLSKDQIEILAGHLTVGETFFFRDRDAFRALEQVILPQTISTIRDQGMEKKIRIWSAACSTGEEPYSIAMIIDQIMDRFSNFSTLILATDINRKAIRKAQTGIYRKWSFRDIESERLNEYFRKIDDNSYQIGQRMKDMVIFDYFNLAEEVPLTVLDNTEGMDVIFCRNVLMYFSQEMARQVLRRLLSSLKNGGWLVAGNSDAVNIKSDQLVRSDIPNVPIFRKKSNEAKQNNGIFSMSHPPDTLEVAQNHFNQGFYQDAIKVLHILRHKPENRAPQVYELLARSYFNQKDLKNAEIWCDCALDVNRYDTGIRYLSACIKMAQNKETDAIIALKQCLYIDDHFIPAFYHMGKIASRNGDLREANRYFEKALVLLQAMDPNSLVPAMGKKLTAGKLIHIIITAQKREHLRK